MHCIHILLKYGLAEMKLNSVFAHMPVSRVTFNENVVGGMKFNRAEWDERT